MDQLETNRLLNNKQTSKRDQLVTDETVTTDNEKLKQIHQFTEGLHFDIGNVSDLSGEKG